MDNVSDIRQSRLSVSQIAAEFGMARATVAKRLESLGIQPAGKRAGYPVYRLRDIVRICGDTATADDPQRMRPTDRRAWYQSENERLKFEIERGNLIGREQYEDAVQRILKICVRGVVTLADRVERDMRVTPDVVEYIQQSVAETRDEMAAAIANREPTNAD